MWNADGAKSQNVSFKEIQRMKLTGMFALISTFKKKIYIADALMSADLHQVYLYMQGTVDSQGQLLVSRSVTILWHSKAAEMRFSASIKQMQLLAKQQPQNLLHKRTNHLYMQIWYVSVFENTFASITAWL